MKTIKRVINLDNAIQDILDIKKSEIDNLNLDNKFKKWDKWFKEYQYNIHEVKEYLKDIYKWVCCFCESEFEFASYPQIEHFYPKLDDCYPEHICNIKNLHYSCQICNNKKWITSPWNKKAKKGKKAEFYSPNYILDESSKKFIYPDYHDIEYKFKYKFGKDNFIIISENNNDNYAKSTIKLFWLDWSKNRKSLLTKMIKIFDDALKISEELNRIVFEKNNKSNMVYFLQKLSDMMDESAPYSSMIKYFFWNIYIKFYKIYEKS